MAKKTETKKAHVVRQTAAALGLGDNTVMVVVTEYERQRRAANRADAAIAKADAAERKKAAATAAAKRKKAAAAAEARRHKAAAKNKKG